MENGLAKSAEKYNRRQQFQKKRNLVLLILGCIVVFCATYALILPAITQERVPCCGVEAHIHEESCYEATIGEDLTCTLEEDETHVHDDVCYETKVMVCALEEHAHELICYADPEADLENDAVWEAAVSDLTFSGEPAEDLVAVAESQKGYVESTRNFIVLEDGESTRGYTRYGQWYGEPYGEWSGMFGGFCLSYASVDAEVMPYDADCSKWMNLLQETEKFGTVSEYIPGEGDFVFLDLDLDGDADHIGIITGIDAETQMITVIQGDYEHAVSEVEWPQTATEVMGYGMMPRTEESDLTDETPSEETEEEITGEGEVTGEEVADGEGEVTGEEVADGEAANDEELATEDENADESVVEEATQDEKAATEETEPLENPEEAATPKFAQQTIQAVIYTDDTYQQEAKDDKTVITVEGILPEGAQAKAYQVELEEDLVEGGRVITAYDIVIFDAEGKPFEKSEDDEELLVTIQPEDWDELSQTDENYDIYYVPEKGTPEMMESTTDEEAVSFVTDHFSTYALIASGSSATIYLNGDSGNDSRAGTSATTAVKTIEKAMSLVKDGGTIYISGTITITDTQDLDVNSKVTFKRYSSFTGPLITVADGGTLTLSNITLNGGSGTPSASDIATNSTYASGKAKAPIIVVSDGGRLRLEDGAVLEYNSNEPKSSNNKLVLDGYIGLGGAIYCNGTLTMDGGLIQYCEAQCGGGVYVENGNFYMNGGTIDHCYARDIISYKKRVDNFYKNAGGGVYVGDYAIMTMSGGTISNNESSREGGGISLGWLNRSNNSAIESYITTFTMNGGTITGNHAVSTGGGLNITAGRQAFINAGYITYNEADGKEYQNTSSYASAGNYGRVYSGGGIYIDAAQWTRYPNDHAGVPGKAVINRTLITQNKATESGGGLAVCGTSENYIYGDETNGTAIYNNYRNNSRNEIYSNSSNMTLGETVLGGGKYNWTRSGTVYTNSLTDSSAAIVTAKELATVFITNNTAYLGGGIGCNGLIEIGGEQEESTYINIKKVWDDDGKIEHPKYIEVQILQDGKPYGEPVRIYRTYDEDGNEIWPTFYVGGLPAGHKYTIKELDVPGYMATIEQKGQDFIITNTPKVISVSVEKVWADGIPGVPSVTIQLYQNDIAYGDSVELSESNNWFYRWDNLPEADDDNKEYQYSISEVAVDGYTSSIELDTTGPTITTTKEFAWKAVDSLEDGKQYMFVASQMALANIGNNKLGWSANISDVLKSGDSPGAEVLWTYENGKLKNGGGRYLAYSGNNGWNLSTSGSSMRFSDGHLSNVASGYNESRYLRLDNSGNVSGTSKESNATEFAAYTLVTNEITSSDEKADLHYIVTNTQIYELPETGGMGITWFCIAGAFLALLMSVILITKRRMGNQEIE